MLAICFACHKKGRDLFAAGSPLPKVSLSFSQPAANGLSADLAGLSRTRIFPAMGEQCDASPVVAMCRAVRWMSAAGDTI